ncbi:DUF1684 domain-containing protein [Arenimonas composti]|uniref:DUF1684 domain-containing protein n=1 Tax=Arenimonas composti TR7-09 = DSM 18010 TaxID=1121013 RepID=A0A091B8S1_9GAMM|nr:DUF1684 domain-containing protein [Arenimonas composti]KFN49028.1 hypothetical protein P873_12855 [Arenimonas composti TR7-09 = DSM 18010]
MNLSARLALLLMTALITTACGDRGADEAASAEARAAEAARRAHEQEILAWREQRVARLTRPDGWLSLVGMLWLNPGSTFVGSASDNGTRLPRGPAQIGMLTLGADGSASLRLSPGVETELLVDGEPPAKGAVIPLVADTAGSPTVVAFDGGEASFILIERAGRYGLRVRDAHAPTRVGFPGIDYWDIDPGFRYVARFEAHPPGKMVDIVNVLGMVEPAPNPGRVHFTTADGREITMEAVDEGDGRLFFTFADRTSGHGSYAASRMLYADPPGADGTTVLDFNKAYNPPCAFTDFSTCPLPLPENRIDLAVTAGEKKPLPFLPVAAAEPEAAPAEAAAPATPARSGDRS